MRKCHIRQIRVGAGKTNGSWFSTLASGEGPHANYAIKVSLIDCNGYYDIIFLNLHVDGSTVCDANGLCHP